MEDDRERVRLLQNSLSTNVKFNTSQKLLTTCAMIQENRFHMTFLPMSSSVLE